MNEYPILRSKLFWLAATLVLSLVAAYLVFGVYFIHPNDHMFAFGGDALVIYYDMLYHVRYGEGLFFSGMNYPHGEYIFLTDMQGVLTLFLKSLKKIFPSIDGNVVGAIHVANQVALALSSVLVFYILRYFKIVNWRACLFAVLIVFLSPQMFRYGAHFGLAYPFLLPLAILWILRKWNIPTFEKRDVLFLLTMLAFTFNNPYLGFCTAGFLFCAGGVLFLKKPESRKAAFWIIGMSVLILVIPFINFKMMDPVADRIKQQWGFFKYRASFEGLLAPPHSLSGQLMDALGVKVRNTWDETQINLGLFTVLSLLGMIIFGIKRGLKKWKTPPLLPMEIKVLIFAALLMFLYAANYTLYGFAKEWLEEHLGFLLMFKASGRFAWPLYFALSIAGVYAFEKYLRTVKSRHLVFAFSMVAAVVWSWEINDYVKLGRKYNKKEYPNFFQEKKEKEIADILEGNKIDPNEFQAMLTVPKIIEWNDNLMAKNGLDFNAQFYSLRISAFTGLPLVNAQLSRISLGQAANIAQLYSDPIIERELPSEFPNQKDLLLLFSPTHKGLSAGEKYLVDASELIFKSEKYSLYRLPFDRLNNDLIQNEVRVFFSKNESSDAAVVHHGFDDISNAKAFYGKGCTTLEKGTHDIIEIALAPERDTQYVFSAWTRLDHTKYGQGVWHINLFDANEKRYLKKALVVRKGYDVQDGWIRTTLEFPVKGASKLLVQFEGGRTLDIDEVMVYPSGAEVIRNDVGENSFLMNGYKVEKE